MCKAIVAGVLVVVTAMPARAVDSAVVSRAVNRGVHYLRSLQDGRGAWPYEEMGATALAGLTLLECGAASSDKAVDAAARYVREASIDCTHTYSISLAILFLDRLGDADDVPLIESLTVRLLAGQNDQGGWSYDCPSIPADEARRLTAVVRARRDLVGRREPPARRDQPASRELSPEIQNQLAQLRREGLRPMGYGDNSNTQFGTLALWVARRHGLPVEDALRHVDERYRKGQNASGGWPYGNPPAGAVRGGRGWRRGGLPPRFLPDRSGAMTAAGLLGLAVAQGVNAQTNSPDTIRNDPAVRAALVDLAQTMLELRHSHTGPGGPGLRGDNYYFLWSLERVCTALGLKTLGDRDWYELGAKLLLLNQHPDGSWVGNYGRYGADTCFALLFLKQSNLVRDLTPRLGGIVEDPGEAVLKAAGVAKKELADAKKLPSEPVPAEPPAPPAKTPEPAAPPPAKEPAKAEPTPPPPPRVETPAPPPAPATPDQIVSELLKAPLRDRATLLEQLQNGKGVEYTEALAGAIGRLDSETRPQAREALSYRLARMKPDVLQRYLSDDEPEIRRAAALACAMKDLRSHVPYLIPLLRDPDKGVSTAALTALRAISQQRFGPDPIVWQAWWDRRGKD